MKILGLDIGERRIGVAIAREDIISSRDGITYANPEQAIQAIGKICRLEEIEKIIVGIPKNENTFQEDMIRKFAMELAKNFHVPINFVDETLTSKEAERILGPSRLKPQSQKYKGEIDKISARLILEQYINSKE